MSFSRLFKGGSEGVGESGPNFMQNASSFFSSVQAKSDDLVASLKTKVSTAVTQQQHPHGQQLQKKHRRRQNEMDEGEEESSASEYGDDGDPAMYADEVPIERKLSSESIDSLPSEEATKYRSDIKQFVTAMLTEAGAAIVTKNAYIFQGYIKHHTGRSAFSRELRDQTEKLKQVSSVVLRLLVNFCDHSLEECSKNDDFAPAAIILGVAFRIFEQNVDSSGRVVQSYMYEGLRDHSIWQSTRFWNAAVFIALQQEHNSRPAPLTSSSSAGDENENLNAQAELQDSISYNQLSKFAWRMYSLGLGKDACLDFLRKQVDDASLSKEKQKALRSNVLRFYSATE